MDIEHCEDCFFLNKGYCTRANVLVKELKSCLTGVLYKAPRTAKELEKIVVATEKRWRKEGK